MNARVAVAVVFALLLAACGSVRPSVSGLRAVPGATASYPGSSAIQGPGGIEGKHTLFANNPSSLLATYCTSDTVADVTAWFDKTLTSLGWVRDANPTVIAGSDPADLHVWNRGERMFRLEFGRHPTAAANGQHPCPNAYEIRVQ